jgi:hypothetical protein
MAQRLALYDEDLEDGGAAQAATDDPIVNEATTRYKRCAEWEGQARKNWLLDYKFALGDPENGFQWPNRIRNVREIDNKPCLTMNIVRQHNLQIVNEARQNKSAVAFRAVGGGATKDSADVLQALMRQIEYESNAQSAYQTACQYQVMAGLGWWRLVTEYEDASTFDQCIRIKRVWDPLSVYMDPDCQEEDCSDAKFALVFDLVPNSALFKAYPDLVNVKGIQPLGNSSQDDGWTLKDHTRICEYFRKVGKADKLVSFVTVEGERKEVLKSNLPAQVYKELRGAPLTKIRPTVREEIEWHLIAGQKIINKTIWPGAYIPLVKVVGEENIVEGRLDRKGHTRYMKDAQRMYNYNGSAQVEFVALQSKTPWVAAAQAIEEYETMWNSANRINHSVLIYNGIDDQGNQIAPPVRTEPPNASPAFQAGMETAFNQMMMTSGQYQNQLGMQGNERTGEAIQRRQEQSYTAVFHFQDNYASALRYTGKQILDLAPKIYDTRRLLKLKTLQGEEFDLELDPTLKQAYFQQLDHDGKVVRRVLNTQLGKYDVESTVGPAYGTRREETVRAMTLLLTQAPQLVGVIGDLLLSAMDFQEAQEAAMRLKRMVPPQALGKGPTLQEQQLSLQNQQLTGALRENLDKLAKEKLRLTGKEELRDIEAYEAETKRIAALAKELPMDSSGLEALIHQLVGDALQIHLAPVAKANQGDLQGRTPGAGTGDNPLALPQAPPLPGAKQAPDGHWYIQNPGKKGGYLRVSAAKKGTSQ